MRNNFHNKALIYRYFKSLKYIVKSGSLAVIVVVVVKLNLNFV